MKKTLKCIGLVTLVSCLVCSGCSKKDNKVIEEQNLTETIGVNAATPKPIGGVQIPEGWADVSDILDQEGLVLSKGLSSITVMTTEIEGLSQYSMSNIQSAFKDKLKEEETETGVTLIRTVKKDLENGKSAIVFNLEFNMTREEIEANRVSGLYSDIRDFNVEDLLQKKVQEVAYYLVEGDQLTIIDGLTYDENTTILEEVILSIAGQL